MKEFWRKWTVLTKNKIKNKKKIKLERRTTKKQLTKLDWVLLKLNLKRRSETKQRSLSRSQSLNSKWKKEKSLLIKSSSSKLQAKPQSSLKLLMSINTLICSKIVKKSKVRNMLSWIRITKKRSRKWRDRLSVYLQMYFLCMQSRKPRISFLNKLKRVSNSFLSH